MSDSTLGLILQIAGAGGLAGLVQLIIFVIRRRPELRNLDATSGSTALTSANKYIATLQTGMDKMQSRIDSMQAGWDSERATATATLEHSRGELDRLAADLARVRADLAVAQIQIQDLVHKLTIRQAGGMPPL
ncbi:MAG: hypothetical protein ACRDS0_37595 [Pseudonocardiaceae bacterium]